MTIADRIENYLAGPQLLRDAIAGMTAEELYAQPIPGKWSTMQVICHIADFEPIYADRMKRVIAEDNPPLRGGDPDVFAAKLAYEERNIEEELDLIVAVRRHVTRILKTLPAETFQRTGLHSVDGPITLETLLKRITGHIPHHVRFIQEKRQALGC
jgi:uncharacterized damage-inducible protein DinB